MRILVSGASRGIGRAVCIEAASRGHQVHAIVRKKEDAPPDCTVHVTDVRDRTAMKVLLEEISEQIDCFVINAGVSDSLSPHRAESAQKAAEILEINTTAAVFSAYQIAYEWIQRGLKNRRIALVSSLAAGRGTPRTGVYVASKTALVSFAQGFAWDLSNYGIKISVIFPGFVDTDMTRRHRFKPFEISVGEAGKIICDGLEKRSSRIAFPLPMVWIAWVKEHIPYFLFQWGISQLNKRRMF